MAYLSHLNAHLAEGGGRLPREVRAEQVDYLRAVQRADGGFAGRDGDSDLYYTGFGLRALALLGMLDRDVAEPAARFLQQRLAHQTEGMEVVDAVSLIQAAGLLQRVAGVDVWSGCNPGWNRQVARHFERLRRADGGYARSPEGAASSTYQTFLIAATVPLLGQSLVDPQRLVRFALSQRRADGGFVEIRPMTRSGTNPTAAAIGLLRMAGGLDGQVGRATAEFLCRMQTGQGGVKANTRIAEADLLSTFAAVWTLVDMHELHRIDRGAAQRFVHSLMLPGGGFRGAAWDLDCDVEYTFYGLATWALLVDRMDP
ncbi:MAG: hypothetical protein A2W31_18065 [Planctomycetes bacterium RBG_16_64_10]|nr:MAG: hypothetical protein A2W31_18065 [Planctomycetes bacterium RBG_16_64_10]